MPSLREHLDSLQFPDEEPLSPDDLAKPGMSLARFTGGWVAAGQPRWRAYAIYVSSILGGLVLALTAGSDDFDLFGFAGLAFLALGVFGVAETLRGKRFPRP